MSEGFNERMAAFAKAAHPTPEQCIVVVLDLLQAVKIQRWDHKVATLNAVLKDYNKQPERAPKQATEAALTAILENSMNKAAMVRLEEQCRRLGLLATLFFLLVQA